MAEESKTQIHQEPSKTSFKKEKISGNKRRTGPNNDESPTKRIRSSNWLEMCVDLVPIRRRETKDSTYQITTWMMFNRFMAGIRAASGTPNYYRDWILPFRAPKVLLIWGVCFQFYYKMLRVRVHVGVASNDEILLCQSLESIMGESLIAPHMYPFFKNIGVQNHSKYGRITPSYPELGTSAPLNIFTDVHAKYGWPNLTLIEAQIHQLYVAEDWAENKGYLTMRNFRARAQSNAAKTTGENDLAKSFKTMPWLDVYDAYPNANSAKYRLMQSHREIFDEIFKCEEPENEDTIDNIEISMLFGKLGLVEIGKRMKLCNEWTNGIWNGAVPLKTVPDTASVIGLTYVKYVMDYDPLDEEDDADTDFKHEDENYKYNDNDYGLVYAESYTDDCEHLHLQESAITALHASMRVNMCAGAREGHEWEKHHDDNGATGYLDYRNRHRLSTMKKPKTANANIMVKEIYYLKELLKTNKNTNRF